MNTVISATMFRPRDKIVPCKIGEACPTGFIHGYEND